MEERRKNFVTFILLIIFLVLVGLAIFGHGQKPVIDSPTEKFFDKISG